MGWIPDLPDARDYTYRHEAVRPLLEKLVRRVGSRRPMTLTCASDDEGEYFSPPEDQGPLNCSSAFAVTSLVEYFERRAGGRTFEGSKLFLYKVTRNRLQKRSKVTCDTGADLRTTLKSLVQFGVPPEEHWPYDIEKFDEQPSQFLYGLAKQYPRIRYFRLDEPNRDGTATWETIRSFLAAGFPIAFGFPVPKSLTTNANIPYRAGMDSIRGGQAVVAVGYKTNHYGRGQHALLIRSSWGSHWGDNGNGWLPVSFVRNQLARDFWTLVSAEWLDSTELCRPLLIDWKGESKRP